MLTKLTYEQVSQFWDIIKYAVENSLPPIVGEHPDKMSRILSAALCGRLEVWALHKDRRFEGIMVTKFIYDDASDTKNLLIYCVYGYRPVTGREWLEAAKVLFKYAKSKGCIQVIGYTNVQHIIKLAKTVGGDDTYTFVSADINRSMKFLEEMT